MRNTYLKGKYSINGNLLIPTIHQLENDTYISPIDVICDLLGHVLPLDKQEGMSS